MHALVVYESMYGNTHLVADAIGRGIVETLDVAVVPVDQATQDLVDRADLLVVGGPTHVHGMTSDRTRAQAVADASKPGNELVVDPDAEGEGLRDWFDHLRDSTGSAAAFDTRVDLSALVTGRASKGISRRLRRHGRKPAGRPMSFLVTKQTELLPGELDRAARWGQELGQAVAAGVASS